MSNYPKDWTKNLVLKSGVEVFLRPELSSDTEMLWEMFSTLSKESLGYLVHPFTRERIEGWTSNIDYNKNLSILALIQEDGKERIIGSASLFFHSQKAVRHKAELGITIHDEYQDQGLGTAMIKHLLEIAQKKRLKKIYLRVDTENRRAIHAYEKCGFKIEAKLEKEDYINGQFRDDYRMAIFLSKSARLKFLPQIIKIEGETPAYFSWFSDDFQCLSARPAQKQLCARFSPHYITTWTGYARLFCEPNMRLQFGQ